MKYLIVGGDSFLGTQFASYLLSSNIPFVTTSRRLDPGDANRVHLDLNGSDSFAIPKDITHAIFLIGISGYKACVDKPESEFLNVIAISALATRMMDQGIRIIYISSSAVFSRDKDLAMESDPIDADSVYGKQKSMTESQLTDYATRIGALDKLLIIRPTKVLSFNSPIIADWRTHLNSGSHIKALRDMYLSPISAQYFIASVIALVNQNCAGIFHLSGKITLTYYDLATEYLKQNCKSINLLLGNSILDLPERPFYMQKTGRLSQPRTISKIGVEPEPLEKLVERLL